MMHCLTSSENYYSTHLFDNTVVPVNLKINMSIYYVILLNVIQFCCSPGIVMEVVDFCNINNGGCAHKCEHTRDGPICSCRKGYNLQADQKTCLGMWLFYLFILKKAV